MMARKLPAEPRYQAAGSASCYFIALTDCDRRVIHRLSGDAETLDDARSRLPWIRRRHPTARLIRRLVIVEVLE